MKASNTLIARPLRCCLPLPLHLIAAVEYVYLNTYRWIGQKRLITKEKRSACLVQKKKEKRKTARMEYAGQPSSPAFWRKTKAKKNYFDPRSSITPTTLTTPTRGERWRGSETDTYALRCCKRLSPSTHIHMSIPTTTNSPCFSLSLSSLQFNRTQLLGIDSSSYLYRTGNI